MCHFNEVRENHLTELFVHPQEALVAVMATTTMIITTMLRITLIAKTQISNILQKAI
jgi:hypothetical protein